MLFVQGIACFKKQQTTEFFPGFVKILFETVFELIFELTKKGELSNFIWNAIPNFITGVVKSFLVFGISKFLQFLVL